ncbi:hypothetical protein FACS1894125_6670 [Actinomycetota bacterium]|nr:hypothetical protein FACS1894125_6670 [Actinomycetota bacterium]
MATDEHSSATSKELTVSDVIAEVLAEKESQLSTEYSSAAPRTNEYPSTNTTYMNTKANQSKSRVVAPLVFVAIIATGIAISFIAPSTDDTWTKVDVPENKETFHSEPSGTYDVNDTGRAICGNNNDYYACMHTHTEIYNSVCANKSLTATAKITCDSLNKFIDDGWSRYKSCGYGCRTNAGADGKWGYNVLSNTETTKQVSNKDYRPAVTHQAHCYGNVWGVKWGECKK